MTAMDNIVAGMAAGAGVVLILNISDGLSTYIFDGQTLSDKVASSLNLPKVSL